MAKAALTYFIYVLGTGRGPSARTYVGWTTDIDSRLQKHNEGQGAKYTRGRQWELLYAERYATRHDAMSREWHIKRDRIFRKSLKPE